MHRILIVFLTLSLSFANAEPKLEKAVFAGGCFWCMEPPFEKLEGVLSVESGYTGGHKENPTYQQVSAGGTGHLEAVEVTYDPNKISYEKIVEVYWHQIDPTDPNGQFVDQGESYKSAIYYLNDEQKKIAESSKLKLQSENRFKKPIVTEIRKFEKFYKAEDYHQDYYKKNPIRYKYYRYNSGRDKFLEKYWGTKK